MKKLVILTGAGVSAESGISTFRDAGGLWEGHDVMEVASPEGWHANPELVLKFYNARRAAVQLAKPNAAHRMLAELEDHFDVTVITQNVDDLHERGGSKQVVHLHGELLKVRSIDDEERVYDWTGDINLGDTDDYGSQLRPHIVWFGEPVPMIEPAAWISSRADLFAVIGNSLVVYPAAGLVQYARPDVPIFVVDPKRPGIGADERITFIEDVATRGVAQLKEILLRDHV